MIFYSYFLNLFNLFWGLERRKILWVSPKPSVHERDVWLIKNKQIKLGSNYLVAWMACDSSSMIKNSPLTTLWWPLLCCLLWRSQWRVGPTDERLLVGRSASLPDAGAADHLPTWGTTLGRMAAPLQRSKSLEVVASFQGPSILSQEP